MDPRKRLQVLNQSNPSLRVAVEQKPKLQVNAPPTAPLRVAAPVQRPAPVVTAHSQVPQAPKQNNEGILSRIAKPFQQLGNMIIESNRTAYVDLPKAIYRNAKGDKAGVAQVGNQIDNRLRGKGYFGGGYPTGFNNGDASKSFIQDPSKVKSMVGTGAQIGSYVVPGSIIKNGAVMAGGQVLPKVVGAAGSGAVGSLIGSSGEQLANEGKIDIKRTAAETAFGTVAGGGLFGLGRFGGKVVDKVGGKSMKNLATALSGEADAELIKQTIGVDDQLAKFLADETDPELIREVLKESGVNASKTMKVYEASHGSPDQTPEGYKWDPNAEVAPIHVQDTGDGRFFQSGQKSFAPVTNETNQIMGKLADDAMNTPVAPGKTRVYQVTENGQKTDWVFTDTDALTNFINGRESKGMKVDFYDVAKNTLEPTPNSPHVFKVNGGVDAAKAEKHTAKLDELRNSGINRNSKNVVKDPMFATVNSGSRDPLNQVVAGLSSSSSKSDIRRVLEQLAPGLKTGTRQKLVDKLAAAKTPEEVTNILAEANSKSDNVKIKPTQTQFENNTVSTEAANAVSETQSGTSSLLNEDGTPNAQAIDQEIKNINSDNVSETVNTNADQAAGEAAGPRTAAEMFPDADPETQKSIQDVIDSLPGAKKEYDAAAKLSSKEKGRRVAQGETNFDSAGGGEAGFRAKLSALRGKYNNSNFKPLDVSQEAQDHILNIVNHSDYQGFEKINASQALRKLWGSADGAPTPSDISYIRRILGDDVADAVTQAVEEAPKTWKEHLYRLAATPRAAMSSLDFSAALRQGGVLGTRYPKQWASAFKDQFGYFANEGKFNAAMAEIRNHKNYELMNRAKLAVSGAEGVTGTEEQFMTSALEGNAAKKLGVGKFSVGEAAQASNRAYTGVLTKFRADVFNSIVDGMEKSGVNVAEMSDKELKDIGEFINTATGRGGKAGGLVDTHMKTLSTVLFSPRLWASRLNLLNPVYYAKLSPTARKQALQSSASFAATAGTVLGLASAIPGVDVEWDPRSADFAKIKYGNTRYDILGGLQQNIRLGAQLVTGQKINSETGEMATLGDGITSPSRKDLLYQFFENKENPLLGYATKLLEGKDGGGNPINPLTEGAKLLIPLNIQGAYETAKDVAKDPKDIAGIAKGIAMNAPGTFGVGVQTYGTTATKDKGAPNAKGIPEFKGKVTPDMVTDENGKVLQDEKGKPIKVKLTGKETELEKKALFDSARKTAIASQYKRDLSTEDQALIKDGVNLDNYLKDGTISQEKYDQLQATKQNIKNLDGVEIPEGVKSTAATNYYKTLNSLPQGKRDAWLSGEPTQDAKDIAQKLNSTRVKGISEFKPSNQLLKAYAEYEKDLNTHPEYTATDKRNKARAFQVFSAKLNYSEDQKDIFTEGGSSDLKYMIDNGDVSKNDLDTAIKLDNELYTSGLTDSLKFSKKFRKDYGYAVPSVRGSSDSDGSGSSTKTKANVSAFMPSTKKATAVPTFTATPRSSVRFKTNAIPRTSPKSSSVKINL